MKRASFRRKSATSLTRKSSLSRGGKGLKKVGKVGAANIEANKRLAEILPKVQCEIGLAGCLFTWPLHWCHRHKRAWYKGNIGLLSDIQQVVVGCQHCHDLIEHDEKLTVAVFNELRGGEYDMLPTLQF